MFIELFFDRSDLFLLIISTLISIRKINSNPINDYPSKPAEEYVMTSATVDGIQRSNVCGDGYRIEGALLKSFPYPTENSYSPYEDCSMTFQSRRPNHQIRVRILSMDLNDIHAGAHCFDSLKFYKSSFTNFNEKLNSIECGQVKESEKFNFVSPTGIVTAHFSSDSGNVNGRGFRVVLTAFRIANKTHPCNPDEDEVQCDQDNCISNHLLCDGVPHCLDGSDETEDRYCQVKPGDSLEYQRSEFNRRAQLKRYQHWRGIVIVAFLLIIFMAFSIFMVYLLCQRCCQTSDYLINEQKKPVPTIVTSNSQTAQVRVHHHKESTVC